MSRLSNTMPELNADETLAFLEAHDAKFGAGIQRALHQLRYLARAAGNPATFGMPKPEEFAEAVNALNAARAIRWEALEDARLAANRVEEAYDSGIDGPDSDDVRLVVAAFQRTLGGGSR